MRLDEIVKKVKGRYALVSKTTGRPLAYYHGKKGERPSDEWIADQEARVQMFKRMTAAGTKRSG